MKQTIPDLLSERGYRSRIVGIHHLSELQEEIQDRYDSGLLDEDVHKSYLAGLDYRIPASIPNPHSLIVVAYADPPVRFSFTWRGKILQLTVPPTYLNSGAKDAQAGQILTELLASAGYDVAQILAPKKLSAVRSGLARYGKNNIAYVEGLGSYHRLAVFCSNYPCETDPWAEARMLERCEGCQACRRACPSGAIAEDRFLLYAGRCLTLWNEKPWGSDFPEWVEESWHNCLVGCLHCQRVCPENRALQDWIEEGPGFTERETELMLAVAEQADLPVALAEKLQRCGLLEFYELLPRNLLVFL